MMRLMMIQTQILQRLGFERQPNVSATLTEEERRPWRNFFNQRIRTSDSDVGRELYEGEYYAKRYFWHLPSCKSF